jgi:hypothetical protein
MRVPMSDDQQKTDDLENRIRELCARAIITKDEDQLRALFVELRTAMHEKMRLGRARLAELQAAEQEIAKKIEPEFDPQS